MEALRVMFESNLPLAVGCVTLWLISIREFCVLWRHRH